MGSYRSEPVYGVGPGKVGPWMTVRAAARQARPLGGTDAQALEGALHMLERASEIARGDVMALEVQLITARKLLSKMASSWPEGMCLCGVLGTIEGAELPCNYCQVRAFLERG